MRQTIARILRWMLLKLGRAERVRGTLATMDDRGRAVIRRLNGATDFSVIAYNHILSVETFDEGRREWRCLDLRKPHGLTYECGNALLRIYVEPNKESHP